MDYMWLIQVTGEKDDTKSKNEYSMLVNIIIYKNYTTREYLLGTQCGQSSTGQVGSISVSFTPQQ